MSNIVESRLVVVPLNGPEEKFARSKGYYPNADGDLAGRIDPFTSEPSPFTTVADLIKAKTIIDRGTPIFERALNARAEAALKGIQSQMNNARQPNKSKNPPPDYRPLEVRLRGRHPNL